jgi:diketogulonate reductase-like aldo/keto reductase
MNSISDSYVLSNGYKIPCVGFGTWKLDESDSTVDTIKTAIDCGYRHIDTAYSYYNEKSVGKAIRSCSLKREDLFVTTKLGNGSHGYEKTLKEFEISMNNLDIDYVDLYLIHWPRPLSIRDSWREHNEGSWKAFEELYKAGKIKAIGVSNFLDTHLDAILETATIAPMVNQLELHPRYVQTDVVQYCKDRRMIVEAWSPLIKGDFSHPVLVEIASKYNKSVAQILLGWSIQQGFLPLPKSSNKERMIENSNIFDFKLSDEDLEAMKVLETLGRTGAHPDTAEF